jgi:hypothetical protein
MYMYVCTTTTTLCCPKQLFATVLQPLLQSYTSSEDYEPLREAAAYVHQVKPFSTRVRRKKVHSY